MRRVTPLAIIVAEPAGARLLTALTLAAAAAALGRNVAILFDGGSVVALGPAAEPGIAAAIATARDLGVAMTACQSGLAAAGLGADTLPEGAVAGGMISFLQAHADAQLLLG